MTKKGGSRARLQQDGQDAAGKEAKWAMVAAEGEESRLTAGDPPPTGGAGGAAVPAPFVQMGH